jgi:uncharacterized protein
MIFNLLLFLADAVFLGLVRRFRSIWAFLGFGALYGILGFVAGWLLAIDRFHLARLAAYGLFLHAPLLLLGTTILWRKTRKIPACGCTVVAVGLVGVAGYAFLVEPFWLDVTHYRCASPKIKRPARIVVLADLQTDHFGDYEQHVFEEALAQKPDIILLAGDYLQTRYSSRAEQQQAINAFLRKIKFSAPRGIFVIKGNIDHDDWQTIFAGTEATVADSHRQFARDDIQITCLNLGESFSPVTVPNPRPETFHIVLGHAPNFALGHIDADLLVAGHTHGGQVRIPFFGPFATLSAVPRSWAAGTTDLPGGGKLFVSRGIGMERGNAPRIRFCCRPELAVIDLMPQK